MKYIRRYRTLDSSSIVIAGTKTDLEHFRTVRETDGSRLTYSLNCGFYEISISENYGDTMNMFNDILRRYLSAHPGHDSPTIISPPHSPLSPFSSHKEIKSPSSWAKVKGLKTMPFRRKSVQSTAWFCSQSFVYAAILSMMLVTGNIRRDEIRCIRQKTIGQAPRRKIDFVLILSPRFWFVSLDNDGRLCLIRRSLESQLNGASPLSSSAIQFHLVGQRLGPKYQRHYRPC